MSVSHEYLVARAVTWLRNQACPLVLAEMASCSEIPDAIGFARNHTIVVECKTSKADFHRDRVKYGRLVSEDGQSSVSCKSPLKWRKAFDGRPVTYQPNMGTQRFYLCEPDVITPAMVEEHHPDHGLLYLNGKKIMRIIEAPQRLAGRRNAHEEVQYLQFAMRHLLENLGSAGVKVNVLTATKMFGRSAIDLHDWKKQQLLATAPEPKE